MEKQHYQAEQNFWDTQGDQAYSVLSEYDQKRLMTWIDWHGDGSVLDIGGGSGAISKVLIDKPETWAVCMDISFALLKHASATKVQADALKLPFQTESFDLIVAAAFFHHLPGLEAELLRECNRILRPGGRIVGYDPNGCCIQNKLFMTDGPLRLSVFSPDERPIIPFTLEMTAHNQGFTDFRSQLFSLRYKKITKFEMIQRYILNPVAKGPLEKYLHRWFFWSARKANLH